MKNLDIKQIISDHHHAIGKLGGLQTAKRGTDYFKKISLLGVKKRLENAKNKRTNHRSI